MVCDGEGEKYQVGSYEVRLCPIRSLHVPEKRLPGYEVGDCRGEEQEEGDAAGYI